MSSEGQIPVEAAKLLAAEGIDRERMSLPETLRKIARLLEPHGYEILVQRVSERPPVDASLAQTIGWWIDELTAWRTGDAETLGRWLVAKGVQSKRDPVDVVAAVRRDQEGRYWLAKRDATGAHGGLANMWEYPGGKVEPGEQLREALQRELVEEFEASEIEVGRVLDSIETAHDGTRYRVTFFEATFLAHTLRKHTEVAWMTAEEACTVEHLPSGTIFNARHLANVELDRLTRARDAAIAHLFASPADVKGALTALTMQKEMPEFFDRATFAGEAE